MKNAIKLAVAASFALSASGAFAAGTVGTTAPFAGFTIDDPVFDASTVSDAPCPAGASCVDLTGSGGEMLQREVTDDLSGDRYVQIIIGEVNGDSEFVNEQIIATGGTNNLAALLRIDEAGATEDDDFFTEHRFYRGAFDNNTGFPALELVQTIGGDVNTFSMEMPNIPNQPNNIMGTGRIDIDQDLGGTAGRFAHRIVKGTGYMPTDFTVSVTDGDGVVQEITGEAVDARGALTATYMGATIPAGGGTFGVLIYRFFDQVVGDHNNATTGGQATEEIRASSLSSAEGDGGSMNGGANFVGGDALTMGWDEDLFGPAP